jgi:hypothetical protein
MTWIDALVLLQAFLVRQATRPVWRILSMAMIIIVIGNAAMGTIRRRIKEPILGAWRSRPILTSIGVATLGCVPLAYWGWHHTLSLVILCSSFLRKPIFWLGDHLFDRWTKPVHYLVRKTIRRNRILRATLRYPRAGLAAVYGTFETVRERRLAANLHHNRHDHPATAPAPITARDRLKSGADPRAND